MGDGASGGGSKGESSSTTNVNIPDFLRPLIEQGANTASGALSGLADLTRQPLVAGFNEDQTAGFDAARNVASGASGDIPQLQELLRSTASGRDLSSFLPESALSGLTSAASGGIDGSIDPVALEALRGSAGGDFLFGGEGFDEQIRSAVAGATPHIASAFGGSIGGLSGSSARQAVGDTAARAAIDTTGRERQNQLRASSVLAGLGEGSANRSIQAGGLLGNFASAERGRQEQAGRDLPAAGLLGSNVLRDIGGQQQDLEQRFLTAPLEAQMQLLRAALAGTPLESLLGQTTDSEQSGVTLGFGGG